MKQNRFLSLLFKEEKGTAMILVALCMFMLIGFTAIVVDAGSLYFEKSRLQKAMDAAALGGAQRLLVSKTEAESVAADLASKNGFSDVNIETVEKKSIKVSKTVNKQLTFARVLGFHSADVAASASAEIKHEALIEADNAIPVGIEKKDYAKGASYVLNKTPGEGHSGNYGFLAVDGIGADYLGDGIKFGTTIKVPSDLNTEVLTEPGMNWGKVESGFDFRITKDSTRTYCSQYETADNTCERVVILPIVDEYKNGRSKVKILNFAAFWIESVNDHEAKGRFIEIVTSGTFKPGEGYGIYKVKLVD